MRRGCCGSRDANHRDIVRALEAAGRSVLEIWDLSIGNRHRQGAPDILVGWGGQMLLMEIKNPSTKGKLRPDQEAWHRWWRGTRVVVVHSVAEALWYTGVLVSSNAHYIPFDSPGKAEVEGSDGDVGGQKPSPDGTHAGAGQNKRKGGREARLR